MRRDLNILVKKWNTRKYTLKELGIEYGVSLGTIKNRLREAKDIGIHVEESLKGKSFKSRSRNEIYQTIINRIEKKGEIDKFLEKEIIKHRRNGLGSKKIAEILNISLSKVDFLCIDMKLRGISLPDLPSSKSKTKNLNDEILLANLIDHHLKKNRSLSEIVDIIGISRYKTQNIIYKYLIKS